MPPPTELSFEEILKFMLAHNGKVTNHALVKHFKVFLMNSDKKGKSINNLLFLLDKKNIMKVSHKPYHLTL